MAERKTKPKATKPSGVPDGFKPLDNSKPDQLELDPGNEIVGVLGPVFKSKDPAMPDYRTINVEGKRYYLPSHAGLMVLLEQPSGTRCFIRLNGGIGKKNDPFDYTIGVAGTASEEDGEASL
jgi:hypothetical protein